MILELIPQRETAPLLGSAALKKGTPPVRDALRQLYTTFRSKGTARPIVRASACVSSGGLSLRVAADPEAVSVEK